MVLTAGLLFVAPAGPAPLAVDAAGIQSDGAASATRAQALPLPPRPDAPTALAAPSETGAWGPLLDWGIQGKHMALLSTGRVLVWSTGDNARVWDPSTGLFTLAPATFGDLHCAGQSILADGRVIVVGGVLGAPHDGTNITALFDPVTQTWTRGQDMTDLRWYATSTTLADGRVLATSGDAPDGTRPEIPDVHDPVTDTGTPLTFRHVGRDRHRRPAHLIPEPEDLVLRPVLRCLVDTFDKNDRLLPDNEIPIAEFTHRPPRTPLSLPSSVFRLPSTPATTHPGRRRCRQYRCCPRSR